MTSRNEPHYLLGHSETELHRLDIQGALYRDITRRALVEAGVESGMRILDIGCGTGDVSLLAAELTGPGGEVVGIDRGEAGLEAARAKARDRGLANVTFEQHEIDAFERPHAFDALVGRFVLMHQSDPATVLRSVLRSVRPGGCVAFVESYMALLLSDAHSFPTSALYGRIVRFKCDVVRGAGADLHAGARLRSTFLEAGLPAPTCRLETRVEGGPESPYYEYVAQSVRSMLPEARRSGVEGFTSDDVPGLEQQLRDEVTALGGVLLVWPTVSAWVRTGS